MLNWQCQHNIRCAGNISRSIDVNLLIHWKYTTVWGVKHWNEKCPLGENSCRPVSSVYITQFRKQRLRGYWSYPSPGHEQPFSLNSSTTRSHVATFPNPSCIIVSMVMWYFYIEHDSVFLEAFRMTDPLLHDQTLTGPNFQMTNLKRSGKLKKSQMINLHPGNTTLVLHTTKYFTSWLNIVT